MEELQTAELWVHVDQKGSIQKQPISTVFTNVLGNVANVRFNLIWKKKNQQIFQQNIFHKKLTFGSSGKNAEQ